MTALKLSVAGLIPVGSAWLAFYGGKWLCGLFDRDATDQVAIGSITAVAVIIFGAAQFLAEQCSMRKDRK